MTSGDDDRPCETHQWEPIPEETGAYLCLACCTTGYRSQFHRKIVPHKNQRQVKRKVTATLNPSGESLTGESWESSGGRWVRPLPGAE